ncbi:MAG: hypothetical protein K6G23_03400 [Lachnospiraceae bacterium]|nr:hypothetical protein [Lachnospiraceae bacterium]
MKRTTFSRENFIWALYLGAYLGLAVVLALFQPAVDPLHDPGYMPPDEHFRYLIPKFIYTHGALPTGLEEEVRITGCGFSYGLYNVLPYIIQAGVMKIVSFFTVSEGALLLAARMTNVGFGLVMAIVIVKLAKRLFTEPVYAWLMACAITFLPENLFVHSYVNTDSASLLSVALMLYALVWAYQDGFRVSNSLVLSLGVILCALSYYNTYGFILGSIVLFIGYHISRKDGKVQFAYQPFLRYGALICIVVLLGIGWWFIRAYIVLDGDFLGLSTKRELALLYAFDEVSPLNTYRARGYTIMEMFAEHPDFSECLYNSFVATYGTLSIPGTWSIYASYKVFFLMGIFGIIIEIIGRVYDRIRGAYQYDRRAVMSAKEVLFHIVMVVCMILPLVILIRYCYTMDYQHQGRYLLSASIPLMYYMVRGFRYLANLRIGPVQWPAFLVKIALVIAYVIAIEASFQMVFVQALPKYLEVLQFAG